MALGDMFGGAAVGAQTGGMIGGPPGAAWGAGIGGLMGLIGASEEDELGVHRPDLDLSALKKLQQPKFDVDMMGYLQQGRAFAEESGAYSTANAARAIQAGMDRQRRAGMGALGQGIGSAAASFGQGGTQSWAQAAQGISGQAMQQGTALGTQLAQFDMQKMISEWNANRQNILTELEWMNKAELSVAGAEFAPSGWATAIDAVGTLDKSSWAE